MQKKSLSYLYSKHKGKLSDKWSIYLTEYDRVLKEYKNQPVNMLEIGIQNGGSLEIWGDYFEKAAHIVGCDINERCKLLKYDDERISVIVGDANTDKTERAINRISKSFDIIIDDGSHRSSDIVKSFSRYFPKLALGGVFIAEDLHCSYWGEFEGGLFDPYSSISFFKRLADLTNYEHWGIEKDRAWLIDGFSKNYGIKIDEKILSQIHSVEFINSLCVIRKNPSDSNLLGTRVISGTEEIVVEGHIQLAGSEPVALNQLQNSFANRQHLPEDELVIRIAEVTQISEELQTVRSQVTDRDRLINQQLKLIEEQNNFIQLQNKRIESENLEHIKHTELQTGSIHSLERSLRDLSSVLAERDRHLGAIYASTSWQLTKPVRSVGHQVKRVRYISKVLPSIVTKNGGIKSTSLKAARAFKKHGVSGLVQAWRKANQPDANLTFIDNTIVNVNDYSEWLKRYGLIDTTMRSKILNRIKVMESKPLISIIMPVYNPNIEWLSEAIESIRDQLYDNWELCLADDCSTNPEVKKTLEHFKGLDGRIRIVYREKNGHISEASNSAIGIATGEWLALMDQDDLLPMEALYCVAKAILDHPTAGLIYSDEDKIDERGRRFDPYFKSDWNPDLFLSQNMINHLGAYRADLISAAGGFRTEFVGSQDYDLALRITEQLQPEQIIHIPRVLYHWRSHSDSTAQAGSNKNYALTAGQRALNEHFKRTNTNAEVELLDFGMYRTRYTLPEEQPLVSLIIPTRNGLLLVKQCVSSILEKTTYQNYEIIIVDNNSDDPEALAYFQKLNEHPRIRILRDERPFNYSALNNNAVKHANGDYIGLINNDIEVISADWLDEMVSIAMQPGVGAVGARLWYPNDTLQHGGVIIGLGGVAGHAHKDLPRGVPANFFRSELIQTVSAVTAACLIVSKNIYNQVAGLNEADLTVAFNDVDFCLKIRAAGYRNVWTPYADLYHHESATRGYETTPEKKLRFQAEIKYMHKTWKTDQWLDPAYNPNLTDAREDYSLAWPPRISSEWFV